MKLDNKTAVTLTDENAPTGNFSATIYMTELK